MCPLRLLFVMFSPHTFALSDSTDKFWDNSIPGSQYIESLQNNPNCKTGRFMVVHETHKAGIMAIIRRINDCFMLAASEGRTLVLSSGTLGHYGKVEELVASTSYCKIDDLGPQANVINSQQKPCRGHNTRSKGEWEALIPHAVKKKGHTLHSWWGLLSRWILRPSPRLKKNILTTMSGMGLEPGTIYGGVHVRHGDKAQETGLKFPLKRYLEPIRKHARRRDHPFLPKAIFLASDSEEVIADSNTIVDDALPRIIYQSNVLRVLKSTMSMAGYIQLNEGTRLAAGFQVLTDTWILAFSNIFVGTCTSGVSCIAASIYRTRQIGKDSQQLPIHLDFDACGSHRWWPDAALGDWAKH